ncbi:MAG: peptide ABC transporter permease, partial [Acidobacteriales bacterium]|nr:peptide ABC transporter permease [Terriglobales bacterium]
MIPELLARIRFLILRKKRSEFDEEMRFHLDQSIAAKIAQGMPAAEARRQGLIELGAVEAARDECERQRPGWWLSTVAQDLRYALRGILAHRWFSAAIIVILALGIGLNTMVFTLVNAVLFKPVAVPGGERLVCIENHLLAQPDRSRSLSYPDFQDYRAAAKS